MGKRLFDGRGILFVIPKTIGYWREWFNKEKTIFQISSVENLTMSTYEEG